MPGPGAGRTATAIIPLGFGPPAPAALARALVDAARFGFTELLVPVIPELLAEAQQAAAASGILPHGAQVAIIPCAARTAGVALADIGGRIATDVLLVDPARTVEANWLDLPAGKHAAVLSVSGAADALAPAGLAYLTPDTLAALPPEADLPGLLAHLLHQPDTALWHLPAEVTRPARANEPTRPPRPALFLDRDGTLNEDYGYVSDPDRLVLLPGAAAAVKRANDLGWYVFLVTNQSGVGRGYYAEAQAAACNAALQEMLRIDGAHLDDMRYAADHPDAIEPRYRVPTGWRKPEPGMLTDLMAHWPVMREKSLMVGDKDSDVAAGEAAGIRGLLFNGPDLDAALAPQMAVL
ncbi:hypothetical protein GCM10007301_22280 [Azorhizobium oxalatiphilum]|uniref:D,D-heptose 1,7-bisphosphate phosphatase n=1 Tax=Azorhizobium oxalatiphilum TaxID=980631 RepID=A0A917BZV8_9HYPH|nr:HAD family hydrolase [Azorhizobium oxalatiphilum]GGF62087.1 hypothetical protein GCM10007301_22280 [Azorhizobium oxalatiphilum]